MLQRKLGVFQERSQDPWFLLLHELVEKQRRGLARESYFFTKAKEGQAFQKLVLRLPTNGHGRTGIFHYQEKVVPAQLG
jgi:hypothetical protein